MKNYYIILSFLAFSMFSGLNSFAGYCVTLGDGDWDNPSNWSCGRVPGSGDTIVIQATDSIYVASSYTGLTGVWLQVYGKLQFKNAARIVFMYGDTSIAPSMITFYTGAVCAGGNGSSGLSFGAGGSGCDVYRPGQGTNPGVYPTIPGSYYDGCVWAAYLPFAKLETNIILEYDQMKIEWSLFENSIIDYYEVIGITADDEVIPLDIIPSQNVGFDRAEYSASYPVVGLSAIQIIGHQHNNLTTEIALGSIAQLIPLIQGDVGHKPNPFDKYLDVEGKFTFDVKIYTLEGKLVYEGSGKNSYHINTSEFKSGLYFVETSRNNAIIDRRKILKN